MKKILSLILIIVLTIGKSIIAQNTLAKSDDLGRVILSCYVSERIKDLRPDAKKLLETKLNQIASKNGLAGASFSSRFILTANINIITKDLTASAPPMQAYTLQVDFYVGDGIDGTKFSSTSVTVKGVGENESKAFINAIKNISVQNPNFQTFLEDGKKRIIEYYNTRCDFILKEADMLVSQKKYDAAIFKLVSVPEICKDCYMKSMDKVGAVYKLHINNVCKIKLAEAKATWNGSQNVEGAEKVAVLLEGIDPDASCMTEVNQLLANVAKRIKEIDKRDWDFKIEKEVNLERDRIKAYRDVGVAYGENQPKSVEYNIIGWW